MALGVSVAQAQTQQAQENVRDESVVVTRAENGAATPQPPAPASVQDPDSLRHRLTVSVLFGIDNSFSGKVLQDGSGVLQNVPINLRETSYDDIYGRMGLFKIGVGYRVSPRS